MGSNIRGVGGGIFLPLVRSKWVFFPYFLLLNSILSHGPLSLEMKFLVFLIGILVPLSALCLAQKKVRPDLRPPRKEIDLPPFSAWLICLLAAFAAFLRFYRLTSLAKWPSLDEAMFGYFGMGLSENPDFRLTYGIGQVPPMTFWVLGIAFKVFGVSLATLWAVPAFFSAITVPLVFLAARKFLGFSMSCLLTSLWAFSFWPLYEGRFCVQYPLFMFWLWLTLCLLGVFLNSPANPSNAKKLAALGLATGIGFYISPGWLLVALAVSAAIFLLPPKRPGNFLAFALPVFFLAMPWVLLTLRHEYGAYLSSLWAFHGGLSLKDHTLNFLHYFMGLFWETPRFSISAYGPHWGGLFNPVLGSFFLLGLSRFWEWRSLFWAKFFLGAALFMFTPAFLSKDLEFFRIFQLSPFLFAITAVGIQAWSETVRPRWRHGILAGLLLASLAMDVFHLYGPFPAEAASMNAWPYKSYYRFQAYRVLEEAHRELGEGLVFDQFPSKMLDDFAPRYSDPSLTVASYAFNAAANPKLSWKDAKWAGILCDSAFQPYLKELLPKAVWFRFSDFPVFNEDLTLGFLSPPEKYGSTLEKWRRADRKFRKVTQAVLNHVNGQPYEGVLRTLGEIYPSIQGDPFLESCYWLKFSAMAVNDKGRYLMENNFLDGPAPAVYSFDFLRRPVAKMYQTAGIACVQAGRFSDAKKAFLRAADYQPDYRVPDQVLKLLNRMEKGPKPAGP